MKRVVTCDRNVQIGIKAELAERLDAEWVSVRIVTPESMPDPVDIGGDHHDEARTFEDPTDLAHEIQRTADVLDQAIAADGRERFVAKRQSRTLYITGDYDLRSGSCHRERFQVDVGSHDTRRCMLPEVAM